MYTAYCTKTVDSALKRVVYSLEEIDVQSYIPGEDLFSSFVFFILKYAGENDWNKQKLPTVLSGDSWIYTPIPAYPYGRFLSPRVHCGRGTPNCHTFVPREVENISVYLSTDDFQGRSLLGAGSFGKAILVVLGWNFLYQIWVVSYWICFPCEFCLIDLFFSC